MDRGGCVRVAFVLRPFCMLLTCIYASRMYMYRSAEPVVNRTWTPTVSCSWTIFMCTTNYFTSHLLWKESILSFTSLNYTDVSPIELPITAIESTQNPLLGLLHPTSTYPSMAHDI